ncbi:MAG: hypothetical protein NZ853_03735 [Leptospiraceae bacterium]|nr:hypothetical protein [Leptospiraceae bacterium]MDW7975286.1 hypothetical protein [Leptospiraceae bacterium]
MEKVFVGKKIIIFLLIFNHCLTLYPVKVNVYHNLMKIDPYTEWQSKNQSIKFFPETIVFFLFRKQKSIISNEKNLMNLYNQATDCKEKNDILITWFTQEINKMENLKKWNLQTKNLFQNLALDILTRCQEEIIQRNGKNLLYLIMLYETYQ